MRPVHLRGIDLNLLPSLEALLRLRNVTRAADEVGLSQPAMSRALGRLRDLIGDPLLVRTHGKLALTPKGERLHAQLSPALDGVKHIFAESSFDPALATRTVRMAGVDTQTVLYAPGIMARLAREAPGIDVRFEPHGGDMLGRMDQGALDFVFALSTTPLPAGVVSETIARDRLALVMRARHPWARRRWRLKDYGAVEHVGISIFGDAQSDLDAQLATQGVKRRVALTTPHFIAALAAVSSTDMVTTISRTFAARFARTFGLVLREPPLPTTEMQVTLVSSHVRASDPLLIWLHGVIRDVAERQGRLDKRPAR